MAITAPSPAAIGSTSPLHSKKPSHGVTELESGEAAPCRCRSWVARQT